MPVAAAALKCPLAPDSIERGYGSKRARVCQK
jgi:hypothetical protein